MNSPLSQRRSLLDYCYKKTRAILDQGGLKNSDEDILEEIGETIQLWKENINDLEEKDDMNLEQKKILAKIRNLFDEVIQKMEWKLEWVKITNELLENILIYCSIKTQISV